MRASLAILAEAVAPSSASDLDDKFLSKLDESNWLRHLSLLLAASLLAAQKMHLEEASVLCHCSDGYDRTAQMCSLTQMMLDPYYRTIAGFANLIEKDWCAFGHKFRDRCGHGLDTTVGAEEKSPIFLQFLDATHQLMHQFPTAFEFSSLLLVFLADHSTSCLFGNFIGNSYHQRIVELNVVENTRSIWSVVLSHQEVFTNRRYRLYELPIWPDVSLKSMVLWSRYFLRWEIRCHPKLLPGCEDEAWRDFWDDLALLP